MEGVDRKIDILKKVTMGKCKVCGGEGYLDDGLCECRKKFQNGIVLLSGGFPLDLIRLESPIIDNDVLDFFVKNPDKVAEDGLSLYIHGGLGVGKTFTSVYLSREFTDAFGVEGKCGYNYNLTVQFMEASQFVLNERTLQGNDLRNFHNSFNSSFFVLDDWSNEYKSQSNPAFVDRLYERFLRYRISNCLPTIITTNVPPQEVQGLYDEKIASLLGIKIKKSGYDMAGRFVEVRVDGPDYRKMATDKSWNSYFKE
jgi:DNA replication protein DnaC